MRKNIPSTIVLSVVLSFSSIARAHNGRSELHTRQFVARPHALRNLEVREPPVVPHIQPCNEVLLKHTFANSYGKPACTSYSPPTACGQPGNWASVIFNLTTTSIGKQYDRLGRLYLNDVEIWRTSTAEPTKVGIIWTVTRDVSKYIPLLSSGGSLRLDIGNIVDKSLNLTGSFEVTLSAKFYPPTEQFPASKKADKIINLGHGTGSRMSQFLTFPPNLETAFLEVFASGADKEEFWYTNVPDEYMKKIDPNNKGDVVLGKGSFREVQVWIDGLLAGFAYPFPVIYTGGIIMSWWRPIAAIGAFDAPSYIIDISPFVPYLSDSKAHNFTLVVLGQGVNSSINSEWFFSGSVFVTLDPSNARTIGEMITHFTDSKTTVVPLPTGYDQHSSSCVNFVTKSYRKLSISSLVITGSGEPQIVKTEQDYSYSNQQSWIPSGVYQSVTQTSQGTSFSTYGDRIITTDSFQFPLNINVSTVTLPRSNQTKISGNLTHQYKRSQFFPLGPGLGQVDINTIQTSIGELLLNLKGRVVKGLGRTAQSFKYHNGRGDSYSRNIEVFNVSHVIRDDESGSLVAPHISDAEVLYILPSDGSNLAGCPYRSLRTTIGFGPTDSNLQLVLQPNP